VPASFGAAIDAHRPATSSAAQKPSPPQTWVGAQSAAALQATVQSRTSGA
jgi:hypothetical protein